MPGNPEPTIMPVLPTRGNPASEAVVRRVEGRPLQCDVCASRQIASLAPANTPACQRFTHGSRVHVLVSRTYDEPAAGKRPRRRQTSSSLSRSRLALLPHRTESSPSRRLGSLRQVADVRHVASQKVEPERSSDVLAALKRLRAAKQPAEQPLSPDCASAGPDAGRQQQRRRASNGQSVQWQHGDSRRVRGRRRCRRASARCSAAGSCPSARRCS